jgi:hypothetical protein
MQNSELLAKRPPGKQLSLSLVRSGVQAPRRTTSAGAGVDFLFC